MPFDAFWTRTKLALLFTDLFEVATVGSVAILFTTSRCPSSSLSVPCPRSYCLAKFTVHKKPARPARKGINPFTKQEQTFAAKPASKAVRARSVKAIKDAVK